MKLKIPGLEASFTCFQFIDGRLERNPKTDQWERTASFPTLWTAARLRVLWLRSVVEFQESAKSFHAEVTFSWLLGVGVYLTGNSQSENLRNHLSEELYFQSAFLVFITVLGWQFCLSSQERLGHRPRLELSYRGLVLQRIGLVS